MIKHFFITVGVIICLFAMPVTGHAQVIHEVRYGDSLTKISQQYKVAAREITRLNGLARNARLVLGQALLLPGSTYIVQPGDSLWEIAKRHSLTEEVLMKSNHLKNAVLVPGQKLQIPRPPKTTLWTGPFLIPKNKNFNEWILNYYQKTISSVFIFEYRPDYEGNLQAEPNVQQDNHAKLAWKKNKPPYATITNLSPKGFDPDLTHRLMSTDKLRKKLINNIHSLLHYNHYKGVIIDFERVYPKDRRYLNKFIKELANKLHPSNMEVLIAVPPLEGDKNPSYAAAYDYKTLGKYVDKIFLMTYDWHWPGGPSGPIAPINRVRATLDYAVSVVPRSKLMLGVPNYAYDWTISGDTKKGTAYSVQRAIEIYMTKESQIHYDEAASSPWFRYVDEQGALHEVWFEDPRSLLAKYRLIKEYKLTGGGCWHLGLSIPQTEELLLEEFHIANQT
ncbi:glycosyl hydrolase family 18 protein [Brevibacillus borstelensis]|jgi:spore germination protein|uniref:glycosyl hydrolase family 18 protein n=3 Tax=Brevibacillus TaxID=55080 RepID=UPI000F0999B5|nr:glycosyl hydrolase family 18 protein [Brevibacillus borstelensis]MBE5396426.1 glycoside hydrolase family 18 protein [Brevibacillus borstelensis]MCM3593133.1 glycosyl hydrolase family 18 protein [Brevibacillus borstelensis]MED1885879.1 glycosyl hydrolase family 18 protein [Brevibacillus borstelensis]RNB54338.1 LysM peptidoglycan-binding domain-containing protein [Brevibacillus borstelensis]WNF08260.1 glycosyl hydrolase family 18 protein [Brevibacillus borstelensis]